MLLYCVLRHSQRIPNGMCPISCYIWEITYFECRQSRVLPNTSMYDLGECATHPIVWDTWGRSDKYVPRLAIYSKALQAQGGMLQYQGKRKRKARFVISCHIWLSWATPLLHMPTTTVNSSANTTTAYQHAYIRNNSHYNSYSN